MTTNQEKINNLILKEYNKMFNGEQFIENASDAGDFISHLVYLLTDGKDGELSQSNFFIDNNI